MRPHLWTAAMMILIFTGSRPGMAQEPVHPPREQVNPPQDLAAVPQPDSRELVVPAGTVLSVVLNSYLNTRSSKVGDKFYADIAYPVYIQQHLVIPRGSIVQGVVTQVHRPGRVKGKGNIAIRIDDVLLPNGVNRNMVVALRGLHGPGTEVIDRKSETVSESGSKGQDTGQVISTTGQGALIGGLSGGGKGAGIGAGVGAAAGLATVLFSRGKELVLEPGTQFDLELSQPMRFAYGELDFTGAELNSARPAPTPRPRSNRNSQNTRFPRRPGILGMPIP